MAGPLDVDNGMQRIVLRKGVATANGDCTLVTQYDAPVQPRFLDRPRLHHGERAAALLEAQSRISGAAAFSRLAQ